MDSERIIFFDGIGDVFFKKNKRAKRLTIRVKTTHEVKVTIPFHISYFQAESFVREKAPWINKIRNKIIENSGQQTQFHELTEFSTRNHVLRIERIEGDRIHKKIGNGKILVSVPFSCKIDSAAAQEKIRSAILETWRKEAKDILPARLEKLAKHHKFVYRSVSIKNMKSRWGSCTGRNGINLNLHLVRLPEHLCDYIILHELVHTIHKHHGKSFWNSLDELCGDAKGIAKELKNFRLDIW